MGALFYKSLGWLVGMVGPKIGRELQKPYFDKFCCDVSTFYMFIIFPHDHFNNSGSSLGKNGGHLDIGKIHIECG